MSQWRRSLISVNTHGLMSAPRASITAVIGESPASAASTSSYEKASPLPISGTDACSAAQRPMYDQSAAFE